MRVVLVAVGAPKTPGVAEAIRDYESKVSRYFRFEALEVRPQRITSSSDAATIVDRDSEAVLARVPPGLEVVVVDRRGVGWTSEQLASYLNELTVRGSPGAAFLIGGPLGLSESLRQRASRILSLSAFTLPHELARLLLAEQLYRAGTIRRGEPYHRPG